MWNYINYIISNCYAEHLACYLNKLETMFNTNKKSNGFFQTLAAIDQGKVAMCRKKGYIIIDGGSLLPTLEYYSHTCPPVSP